MGYFGFEVSSRGYAWQVWGMIKPKKKRVGDANQIAASVVGDAIKQSAKPVKFPPVRKAQKRKA